MFEFIKKSKIDVTIFKVILSEINILDPNMDGIYLKHGCSGTCFRIVYWIICSDNFLDDKYERSNE